MTTTGNITSLAGLVTRVRQRSDHQNSLFVTDAEIEQYIQESYFELYDLLIESSGEDHFATGANLTTTPNVGYIDLVEDTAPDHGVTASGATQYPLNIYKLLGVYVTLNGETKAIRPFSLHALDGSTPAGWTSHDQVFYRVTTMIDLAAAAGAQTRRMSFTPTPTGAHTVGLIFIPTPLPLRTAVQETDGVHFLHYAHWDEYIVVDAAMKVLEKEESDTAHLAVRKEGLRQRILWQARTMDTGDRSGGSINDTVSRWAPSYGDRRREPLP